MIPIPPQLTKFAATQAFKNGSKALIAILAVLVLWFVYHSIDSNGFDRGKAETQTEWLERESKINDKTQELLARKQSENNLILEQNHEKYTNAIEEYVEYSQKLERDLNDHRDQRLRVRAKCPASPSGSGGSVSGKTEIPQTDIRGREETEWAELAAEDSSAVWQTARDAGALAKICQQMVFFIESNGMVE